MSYFAQNLKHLRKRSSKTQEQLGHDLSLGRTTIANYEAGFSSPTDPEVLIRLSNVFGVSIDELLTRDLSVAFSGDAAPPETSLPGRRDNLYESTLRLHHPMGTPKVIVVDSIGEERVVFVSKELAGHYPARRGESPWLASLPLYTLPGLRTHTHRMFEVTDAALAPRFHPGDRVVARWAGALDDLRDGQACVLVTAEGIYLRRVLNRIASGGGLVLMTDEPGAAAPGVPGMLAADAVLEAWTVEWVMSANLAPPIGQVYHRIADLEHQLHALSRRLSQNPE